MGQHQGGGGVASLMEGAAVKANPVEQGVPAPVEVPGLDRFSEQRGKHVVLVVPRVPSGEALFGLGEPMAVKLSIACSGRTQPRSSPSCSARGLASGELALYRTNAFAESMAMTCFPVIGAAIIATARLLTVRYNGPRAEHEPARGAE